MRNILNVIFPVLIKKVLLFGNILISLLSKRRSSSLNIEQLLALHRWVACVDGIGLGCLHPYTKVIEGEIKRRIRVTQHITPNEELEVELYPPTVDPS